MAIDDFGTGYGPLGYVQKFPVGTVKIDRSFVSGLGVNYNDSATFKRSLAWPARSV